MSSRFEGKVALISGAGSGMGRAITEQLAEEGARVIALDIDGVGLDQTAQRSAGTIVQRQVDVSDPDACFAVVAECVDEFGRLDVLGNVAGVYVTSHATDLSIEQYRRVMGVNLDGCFFLAQAAIPHLLRSDGNIVNIASNAGLQGVPYSVAYCMSKGGVVQLTRALAVEYLKTGLRVNAIAPAHTNTSFTDSVQFPSNVDIDLARRMGGLRGMAEPEEVAALFAFLASAEARSITGSIYTLDNGLTAS